MKRILFILLFPLILSGQEKVVSLTPAVTELILYAGGKNLLCGRSSVCDFPETQHLPVAGDMGKPFAEKVLSLKPTIVISDARHPQANWELLKRCGIKTGFLPGKNLDDLPENIRKLGVMLNLPDAEKKSLLLAEKIAGLRKTVTADRERSVILFGVSPLISCGKESFIGEALKLAGAENSAAAGKNGYFILSTEEFCRLEVQTIFIAGVPEKLVRDFFSRPLFKEIPAVKNNRIIFLDENKWCRLAPGIITAIEVLRNTLQNLPEK